MDLYSMCVDYAVPQVNLLSILGNSDVFLFHPRQSPVYVSGSEPESFLLSSLKLLKSRLLPTHPAPVRGAVGTLRRLSSQEEKLVRELNKAKRAEQQAADVLEERCHEELLRPTVVPLWERLWQHAVGGDASTELREEAVLRAHREASELKLKELLGYVERSAEVKTEFHHIQVDPS